MPVVASGMLKTVDYSGNKTSQAGRFQVSIAILSYTNLFMLLQPQTTETSSRVYSPDKVFFCPEESQFYAQCIEKMALMDCSNDQIIIEFGAGDGSPVISSLLKYPFEGLIKGYELNMNACKLARSRIQQYCLMDQYTVHNQCFFEGFHQSQANFLIANPPYIPAEDDQICMPALHGGVDGASITMRLLSLGCQNVLLMISAYSNPVETIEHAIAEGYQVVDFMISPLQFGYYSSEPKVKRQIQQLQKAGKAFYSSKVYFLAGVKFKQRSAYSVDLSHELIKVMTAL
jgi:methylase of polypeptide subunit release factors